MHHWLPLKLYFPVIAHSSTNKTELQSWCTAEPNKNTQQLGSVNDLTIGWQHLNLLSHRNMYNTSVTIKASGEKNYVTLALQARPSGETLNYLLSHYSDILSMIIGFSSRTQELIKHGSMWNKMREKYLRIICSQWRWCLDDCPWAGLTWQCWHFAPFLTF